MKNTLPRVLLKLENGIVVAKEYSFVSGGLIGIRALCDNGDTKLYAVDANPTYSQFYGIDIAPSATFELLRKTSLNATGLSEADELPWVDYERSGNAIPGTDTAERLMGWLSSCLGHNDDLLEGWGQQEAGEYAPGFELMWALPKSEIKRLKMREADLSGPASTVLCVRTGASAEDLNAAIAAASLPFLLVNDVGSQGS